MWTAHNILPHAEVFDDDSMARRDLVGRASLIVAHSLSAADEVRARWPTRADIVVIPHGPLAPHELYELPPPSPEGTPRVLFMGRIETYKGVEDLLAAADDLVGVVEVRIVGQCTDPALRARLVKMSEPLDHVSVEFGYVEDASLASIFGWADFAVYPFRRITTSGSLTLGMAAGRVVLIPDLEAFADIPEDAAVRYAPGIEGLRGALMLLRTLAPDDIRARAEAARRAAGSTTWAEIAHLTSVALEGLEKSQRRDRLRSTLA
ncbi:MAG TPA: glycosyltransferase [Mycobacterium sp.]